ncbi:MAG: AAA family ATPase [Verrucomicrobia bacterium]|nr:AAA family ATPase [Verrucomicrobiota bacterium]
MNNIYLPSLKKLRLKNFTLYPNGLDFEYDFINGVNLIIGGNGMGKTTLINIIKYSIIGNYKKAFDLYRTYQDRKIEGRKSHSIDYFKNRLDSSFQVEGEPSVSIEFSINKTEFIVERTLSELSLSAVKIKSGKDITVLEGDIIPQYKYDNLEPSSRAKHLYYNYEQAISKASNISFDDLIFFVNEILFFGEDHRTILWNDGYSGFDVQNELFNKYFNEPKLDLERQEAERQAKYMDSLSRHRSEDIKAIRKILDKIENKNKDKEEQSLEENRVKLVDKVESLDKKILNLKTIIESSELKVKTLNNQLNELSLKESGILRSKKAIEKKINEGKWLKQHEDYSLHYQNIVTNGLCPMCSNELEEKFISETLNSSNQCFLCNNQILQPNKEEEENELKIQDNLLRDAYTQIGNTQKLLIEEENRLNDHDKVFKDLTNSKRQASSNLRDVEYELSQLNPESKNKLQEFYDEIAELEKLKNDYAEKSKDERSKANEISKRIEAHISSNTKQFSDQFSKYASKFLGVECALTYDKLSDGKKRFYPVIDNKLRLHEEALSESQRFFVDHSFRMSILSFFYTTPSFYMVETPDSSLDISYEKNAAAVFAQFLEKPKVLILTTNLNNSDFLKYLIKFTDVQIINLLEIGKVTSIQKSSDDMKRISNELKSLIT